MPATVFADHVRLSVRLTPNGGRDAIDGVDSGADGERLLKVRVSAVPENGKANKALVALLAKQLKLPKSSISVVSGETSRKKILRLEGEPEAIMARLAALTGAA
jgi:uncharacterized protein (TIGR00251 family)